MRTIISFILITVVAVAASQDPSQENLDVIRSITDGVAPSSPHSPPLRSDRVQLELCDCDFATGPPGSLSCEKEGFFITSFERQGQWVAGGGAVPLSRAICCRPCLPKNLPDEIFARDEKPLAVVSLGCHASSDPLGVRCEPNANSFISGFTDSVRVFSAVDTQYPINSAQCCTPALLRETGDVWELERCGCGTSEDSEHPVSCGGGDDARNSSGQLLSGFDFFRLSPLGQVVPIGPAKCCGVCLSGKIHPAADCSDLNHCSGNGVCLLGRCECLDGWGAADCSQAWGRRGGWGGRVPPWAIALIVIGSSLLAMALLTAAAHIAELIAEAREAAEEGGDGGGGGGGEGSRQPLLLRIDGDDGGSVGSEDTASWGGDDDAEDVEGRIESVISRLEEGMHRVGGGGGGGGDAVAGGGGSSSSAAVVAVSLMRQGSNTSSNLSSGISTPAWTDGMGDQVEEVEEEVEEEEEDIEAQRRRGGNGNGSGRRSGSVGGGGEHIAEEVEETAAAYQQEETATAAAAGEIQKPEEGGGGGVLQSYTGVGPLSDIDCVVCMIRPVQSVLVPCGHLCMCRRCSRRLTRCPICRKTIARRQRLYV